ncbi:hypothetical protein HHL17_20320 [Chitinophaga sp. G-6-1-13]|uniref:Uncharacterized protein n=1 Tax=Chitinophaga fulva TaxID=2728842 RepID=A0A848GV11_9BACT|nr:hypothetical protein [Chitinophaga fulva]NML39558.1 hypothetical protein [Chitinophaga fulva]
MILPKIRDKRFITVRRGGTLYPQCGQVITDFNWIDAADIVLLLLKRNHLARYLSTKIL